MKSFFKPFVAASAVLASVSALIAAPSPKFVAPSSDFAIVTTGLDYTLTEAQRKTLEEKIKELGLPQDADFNQDPVTFLNEKTPGLGDLYGALTGFDAATKKAAATSMVAAIELSRTNDTIASKIVLTVENPKADLAQLKASIEKIIASQPDLDCKMEQKGEWLQIIHTDADADKPATFDGVTTIAGGYLVVSLPSYELAETYRMGTNESIDDKHALMKAFAPAAKDAPFNVNVAVKNITQLTEKLLKPEDIEDAKSRMPFLFKMADALLTLNYNETCCNLAAQITTDSEATAQELTEMCIGYKAMMTGMILPMALGKPESQVGNLFKKIRITSNAAKFNLAWQLPYDDMLKALKEIKEMEEAQEQQAFEYELHEDSVELDDLDDLDDLLPEDAEDVLDAID